PPHARTAGAPAMRPNFGAGWAGSGHRLSTLRPGSRLPGRKTRFRLLARLYRVGSLTHWVPPKGFELYPTSLLLSQASPGASALRSGTRPAHRSEFVSRRSARRSHRPWWDRTIQEGWTKWLVPKGPSLRDRLLRFPRDGLGAVSFLTSDKI